MTFLQGVDISSYQGNPNFDQLKAENIDFVIARASYGVGYTDAQFPRNRIELRRTGTPHGFYHYAYPEYNAPEKEADWFISVIGDLDENEFLALDFEEKYTGNKDTWCRLFLDRIGWHLNGYKPLLYINESTMSGNDWTQVIQANYGLWLALWDGTQNVPASKWPVVSFKQYTDKTNVGGIEGNVDGDIFFGDIATLNKYGYHKPSTPGPSVQDLQTQVQQKDTKIIQLTNQVTDLEQNVDSLKSTYGNLINENRELKTTITSYKTQNMNTTNVSSVTPQISSSNTLGDDLKSAGVYSATTQVIVANLLVVASFLAPQIPIQVLVSVGVILGVIINLLLVYIVKKNK